MVGSLGRIRDVALLAEVCRWWQADFDFFINPANLSGFFFSYLVLIFYFDTRSRFNIYLLRQLHATY